MLSQRLLHLTRSSYRRVSLLYNNNILYYFHYQHLHNVHMMSTTSNVINKIRNVGIVAHIDAGKTTTTEQFLYCSGVTDVIGRVDNGNSVMDFLPQERERGITISSAAISFEWNDCNINLIDTPGHVDFTIEVERSVRAMDGAVIIVDALAGVQAQTRTVWKQVKNQNLACIAFINKMDRDGSNFDMAVSSLQSKLGATPIPIQLPLMKNDEFHGVVDLVGMKCLYWENEKSGDVAETYMEEVNSAHEKYDDIMSEKAKLVEKLADADEEFLEIFLGTDVENISEDDIVNALGRACRNGYLVPALCGASLKSKGIEPLLNAITRYLPSPLSRTCLAKHYAKDSMKEVTVTDKDSVAFAFKVIVDPNRGPLVFIRNFSGEILSKTSLWNSTKRMKERSNQLLRVSADELVNATSIGYGDIGCIVGLKNTVTGDTLVSQKGSMKDYVLDGLSVPDIAFSLAIEPEKSSQYDNLIKALSILVLEDPSLRYEVNDESGQLLLHGIGELHLEVICDKLRNQYNIPVEIANMFVAYRESIEAGVSIEDVPYEMEKVIGGKRFSANITGSIWHNSDVSIPSIHVDDEVRKSLSNEEYYALTDGLQKSFLLGPAGYPVIGLSVRISALTFEASTSLGSIRAGAAGFIENTLRSVNNVILEPYMSLQIDLPSSYVGDVLSDLTVKRKAAVQDVVAVEGGEFSVVLGYVPLSTMLGYASTIRSLSQGQGSFTMEYLKHDILTSSQESP